MSKIHTEFKLKDLYAIKHSLEKNIKENSNRLNLAFMLTEEGVDNLKQQLEKDISHEKGIVEYLVEIISKYKKTEEHYNKAGNKEVKYESASNYILNDNKTLQDVIYEVELNKE